MPRLVAGMFSGRKLAVTAFATLAAIGVFAVVAIAQGPDATDPARDDDGIAEDPRTTWGNTLGWIVMPGADTWAAKQYKGYVFATDMVRGFDVFRFADCSGAGCAAP